MSTHSGTDTLELAQRKLDSLRKERIIATDAAVKFKLDEDIRELLDAYEELRRAEADRYQLESFPSAGKLLDFLRSIDYEPVDFGPLFRVNCDRRAPIDQFWAAFDRYLDLQQYQVYLVTACGTQMPEQFAERLLWELMKEEETEAPYFRSRDNGRPLIETLPLRRNLRKSQEAFEKYIAELFELRGSHDLSAFLSGEVVNYEYDYIVLNFSVLEQEWRDFIPDYYRWIIAQLRQMAQDGPRFLLTFVHFALDIHREDRFGPRQQSLITALDALEQEEAIAKHINRLREVPVTDLYAWLKRMGVNNVENQRTAVDIIVESLRPEDRERYAAHQTLNMTYIDLVQDIIYKHRNR